MVKITIFYSSQSNFVFGKINHDTGNLNHFLAGWLNITIDNGYTDQ